MRTDGQPELENREVPTAESSYLNAEATQVVRRFRESISDPVQQAILSQYFVEGVSEEAIASTLGITRYKVRKHISLLDRRMRRYLRQHGLP
jgi:DNA-directed RNA polymerase specialized sigma24 family protein